MKNIRKKLVGLALAGCLALSSVGAGVGAAPAQAWSPVVGSQCPRGAQPWVPGWLHMKWCNQGIMWWVYCKQGGNSPYSHC